MSAIPSDLFLPDALSTTARNRSPLVRISLSDSLTSGATEWAVPSNSCWETTPPEAPNGSRTAVTETSTSTNSLEFPILKLDPAEFVRIAKAQYHQQLQRYRTMCEQEEQRRTTGSVASETPRVVTESTAPGAEQSTLPRRSEPYSRPREFFRSDAAFVEDALRRFVVSDADCVDYEKRTWHRRCRGCCTAPDSSSSNDLHHE